MQGSKKWEIDVGSEAANTEEIVGLTWSPDGMIISIHHQYSLSLHSSGQSIAVAHDPPRITLHSIQDGQEERVLSMVMPSNILRRSFRITGVWWFQEEQNVSTSSIPDMFKRDGTLVRATRRPRRRDDGAEQIIVDRHSPLDSENPAVTRSFTRRWSETYVCRVDT